MSNYCENCGCKVYSGKCTNCHEESFILDQYYELGMEPPDDDSEFMGKIKCITFDKKAQDELPEHIKAKMKADREKAKNIHPEEAKEWESLNRKPQE